MPQTTGLNDMATWIQLFAVVSAAIWAVGRISTATAVIKASVERLEKQILRIQESYSRMDRRVTRLETMAGNMRHDSPPPDDAEE